MNTRRIECPYLDLFGVPVPPEVIYTHLVRQVVKTFTTFTDQGKYSVFAKVRHIDCTEPSSDGWIVWCHFNIYTDTIFI